MRESIKNTKKILAIGMLIILFLIVKNVGAISESINIHVVETQQLKIDFVPIDQKSVNFSDTIQKNRVFIGSTYPPSHNGLVVGVNEEILNSSVGNILEKNKEYPLLKKIYKKGRLSGSTDRVVGIVPSGGFSDHGLSGTTGFTKPSKLLGHQDELKLKNLRLQHSSLSSFPGRQSLPFSLSFLSSLRFHAS
jgi:hypothetical protein